MRYDAYRLPGVKWISRGIASGAPQPDCWPDHVIIEGVRVKTVKGKGWGLCRAYYQCPECDRPVKRLYSSPCQACMSAGAHVKYPEDESSPGCRRCNGTGTLVRCWRHVTRELRGRDDAELAARRLREKAQKYLPGSPNWRDLEAQARDLDNVKLVG